MSTARAHSTPGASVTGRLLGRAQTRVRVGPPPSFYHRLGLPGPMDSSDMDPDASGLSPALSTDPAGDGGLTYLSAAGYYRDLRRSRFALLSRLSSVRAAARIGERLKSGPAFAVPMLPGEGSEALALRNASILLPPDLLTVLEEPSPTEDAALSDTDHAQGRPARPRGERGSSRRQKGTSRKGNRTREPLAEPQQLTSQAKGPSSIAASDTPEGETQPIRPRRRPARKLAPELAEETLPRTRPLSRAASRATLAPRTQPYTRPTEQGTREADTSLFEPLIAATESLPARARRRVQPIVERLLADPTPEVVTETRRVLRSLRGTSAAITRGEQGLATRARPEGDWVAAVDRPADRALGRGQRTDAPRGRSRGLSPVLSTSPSWVLVEAEPHETSEEIAPESTPRRTRRQARTQTSRVTRPERSASTPSDTTRVSPRRSRAASASTPEAEGAAQTRTVRAAQRAGLREPQDLLDLGDLAEASTTPGRRTRRARPLATPAAREEQLARQEQIAALPPSARAARRARHTGAPLQETSARGFAAIEESAPTPTQHIERRARIAQLDPNTRSPLSGSLSAWMSPEAQGRPSAKARTERLTRTHTLPPEPELLDTQPQAETEVLAQSRPKRAAPVASARVTSRAKRERSATASVLARAEAAWEAPASSPTARPTRTRRAARPALATQAIESQPLTASETLSPVGRPSRRPALRAQAAPKTGPALDLLPKETSSTQAQEREPLEERLTARAHEAPRLDSRGAEMLSRPPVARRPEPLVLASESVTAEEDASPDAPRTAGDRTRSPSPRTRAQAEPRATASRPRGRVQTAPERVLAEAEATETDSASTEPISRRSPRRSPQGVPAPVGVQQTAPFESAPAVARPRRLSASLRAASRTARPAPRQRVALSASPVSYLSPEPSLPTELPASGAEGAPRRPRRPTAAQPLGTIREQESAAPTPARLQPRERAAVSQTSITAERAEISLRLDSRGRAMLTPRVIADLTQAIYAIAAPLAEAEDHSEAASVVPGAPRRTRTSARPSQGLAAAARWLSASDLSRSETLVPRVIRTLDDRTLSSLLGAETPEQPTFGRTAPEQRAAPRASTRGAAAPQAARRSGRAGLRSAPVLAQPLSAGESAERIQAPNAQAPTQRRRRLAAAAAQRAERAPVQLDASRWAMGIPLEAATADDTEPREAREPRASRGARRERDLTLPRQGAASEAAGEQGTQAQATPALRRRRRTAASNTPRYARHAAPEAAAAEPDTREAFAGRSILSALARSGDPEEVVRLVLQRGPDLERAARAMPTEAQTLVQRIITGAHRIGQAAEAEAARPSGARAEPLGARSSRTSQSAPAFKPLRAVRASAKTVDGAGASQMMKMAGKLMKLIHLAESERRAEAQRQMRMSEVGTGPTEHTGTSSPSFHVDETAVEVLQHKVVGAVLNALKELEMDEGLEGSDVWG